VNRPQQFVQSQAVLHGQHELGDELTGFRADDHGADDPVTAGGRQHFDEAAIRAVGDRAIQLFEVIARHLDRDTLRARLVFG
jgi:hypothetical protein